MNRIHLIVSRCLFFIFTLLSSNFALAGTGSGIVAGPSDGYVIEEDPYFGVVPVGDSVALSKGVGACIFCRSGTNCQGSLRYAKVQLSGSSNFTLLQDGCSGASLAIHPGQSRGQCCKMTVQYRPDSLGEHLGNEFFSWVNSAGDSGSFSTPLSGQGKVSTKTTDHNECVPAHSTINIDQRAVSESLPLVGINFNLNYSSQLIQSFGVFDIITLGLGGWRPSTLHYFDVRNNKIYEGNGSIRQVVPIIIPEGYAVADRTGNRVYLFNTNGQHTETRETLLGNTLLKWEYDPEGRVTKSIEQFGQITNFEYFEQAVKVTAPHGQASTLQLDDNQWLSVLSNPIDEKYLITADPLGFVTKIQKPGGQITQFTFDEAGFLVSDLGPGGSTLNLTPFFDSLTQTQTVKTSSSLSRQTLYESTSTLNGTSHRTTQADASFRVSSETDQGPSSWTNSDGVSIDSQNSPDPRWGWMSQFVSHQTLQVAGSPVLQVSDESRTVALSEASNPLSTLRSQEIKRTFQSDPSRIFVYRFDSSNKSLTSISPMGRTISKTLNTNGQIIRLQMGNLLPFQVNYDSEGRINQLVQGTKAMSLKYDEQGNIAQSTNFLGQATAFQYDGANRPVKQILPGGNEIKMSYDPSGNLIRIVPPGKPEHNFIYNALELIGSYLPPGLGLSSTATLYSYNLDKQLTQITRPDGLVIHLNYNPKTALLESLNTPEGIYQYSYLPNSALINSIKTPDNQILNFQYQGNILTKVENQGTVNGSLANSYQADGNIAQISTMGRDKTPHTIAQFFDKDGLLVKAGNEFISRNNIGAISQVSLGKLTDFITYDNFGQVIEVSSKIGKSILYNEQYFRDALGRISSVKEDLLHRPSFREMSYEYDTQGRLRKVYHHQRLVRDYKYDENGNRIELIEHSKSTKATYNAQDRLIKYGDTEFKYSDNGDLQEKIEVEKYLIDPKIPRLKPRILKSLFNYDSFGNLRSVSLPNGKRIEYIIDGQNRRIGKKVNGKLVQGFIYQSQNQIAAELDNDGKIIKQFIYGSKVNIPDYMIYKNREYKIISNQVGTPTRLVDSSNGITVEILDFNEFGIPGKPQIHSLIPFGFAGGIADPDTGLVRLGARDYDPEVGRWVSKDPILFGGKQTNLYGYSFNDPVNFIDPTGTVGLGGAIIGGILGGVSGYLTGVSTGVNPAQSALVGAGIGAASGFTGAYLLEGAAALGVGTAGQVFAGAFGSFQTGFLGSLVSQHLTGQRPSVGDAVKQGGMCAVGTGGGAALGLGYSSGAQMAIDGAVGTSLMPIELLLAR